MKVEDTLTTLFRHHLWANLKLLECCAGLTREQLDATMVGAYGSIYETLEHFVRSEKSYLWRITTGTPYIKSDHAPLVTIAEMMDSVRATGAGLIEWAPKLKADDMVEVDWEGPTVVLEPLEIPPFTPTVCEFRQAFY